MIRKIFHASLTLVVGFSLLGCTAKKAPDCNHDKTKKKILEKFINAAVIIPAVLGAKSKDKNVNVEEFKKNNIKIRYSNNRVAGTLVGLDFAFHIENIRTINFNKDLGRYECACSLITEKMGSEEKQQPLPLNYTSELSDGSKHYVSVTVLDLFDPTKKFTLPDINTK